MNPAENKQKSSVNKTGIITLLAANLFAIWQFGVHGGSALQVLWVYWIQSVIIGIINVLRILFSPLDPNDTSVSINSRQRTVTYSTSRSARLFIAGFFTVHYGMFHFAYGAFLALFSTNAPIYINGSPAPEKIFKGGLDIKLILASGAAFAVHHALTYIIENTIIKTGTQKPPTLAQVMLRPYARIFPMHLIIIFGPFIAIELGDASIFLVFMALKTIADMVLFYKGTGHPGNINPSHPTQIH